MLGQYLNIRPWPGYSPGFVTLQYIKYVILIADSFLGLSKTKGRYIFMKMQIILLYAGQYDMTDDSGKRVQGTSVNYYFNTDLVAEDNVNGTKGTRPAKSSCEFQVMGKIKRAPALYDAEFSMSIGSDGKPVLKIIDLDYISDVQITPVPDSQFNAKQEQEQKPDKKVS